MTTPIVPSTRTLPARPSLESLRKQAKKLAREHSVSQRAAQLAIARDYGFSGWQELRAEVLKRTGRGLDWAVAEAEHLIHNNDVAALTQLLVEFPTLATWRDDEGESLLKFAASSFGDSGDPFREKMFTRSECAEVLLDAGAVVDPGIWKSVVSSRAKTLLDLFWKKNALSKTLAAYVEMPPFDGARLWRDIQTLTTIDVPLTVDLLAALGEIEHLQAWLIEHQKVDLQTMNKAFLTACRWRNKEIASILLDRCMALDSKLRLRVESRQGRSTFIEYFGEHPVEFGDPWRTLIANEAVGAMLKNDLTEFSRLLHDERWLLDESSIDLQVELIEKSTYNGRDEFIDHLLSSDPAILKQAVPPPSAAIGFAFEYGKANLIPLLTRLWRVPDDLPHAAGMGDLAKVKQWFDVKGSPSLGDLSTHHPCNCPGGLMNLRWGAPNAQQVLDVALAWACMNRHFEVAQFLLDHGANINTTWSTHEPASLLHECAIQNNFEAAQFLLARGIDATIKDYRWDATAAGWAYHAAKNAKMGDLLYAAEEKQLAAKDP